MVILSFGLNAEQEEIVLRRMALSRETNKSAHFRRVYFESDLSNDKVIGSLTRQIEMLTEAVNQSHKLTRQLVESRSGDIELKLLAGIYMLMYRSVGLDVRATVDEYLDATAVEGFLQGDNKKRRR